MNERRTSIRFSRTVDPGETVELTRSVPSDATIESLTMRFYPGTELQLSVLPYKENERGDRIPLVDLVGRQRIVGHDDTPEFKLSEPVDRGDTIGVKAVNNSADYSYDVNVDMDLDYANGKERLSNAVSRITEVLG